MPIRRGLGVREGGRRQRGQHLGIDGHRSTDSQDVTFGAVTVGTGGYSLGINGVTVLNATSGTLTASDLVSAINSYSTQDGGVTAAAGGNGLILTAADGSNIQLNQNLNPLAAVASTGGITHVTSYNAATSADIGAGAAYTTGATAFYGEVSLAASQNIQVGGLAADLTNSGFAAATTVTATGTLQGQNVLTVYGGQLHDRVGGFGARQRQSVPGQLGAIQNRFQAAVSEPAVDQPEPDPVAQHHPGCELRAGNGELDPGPGVGTGRHLGVGAGQPAAAADPQASAVTADS